MRRFLLAGLFALLLPAGVFAARAPATFSANRSSLVVADASPGNVYELGASIVSTASVVGDLSAAGGSVVSAGPISGDALLAGGTVSERGPVAGDVRAVGGTINSEASIGGDLAAFGFSVTDSSHPSGSVLIVAADASVLRGAAGPVTVYGNNVYLAGDFGDNVTVVATGRLALSASTTIAGKLSYEAPEPALIPSSVRVAGGVHYSNASYLPDAGTSKVLALAGIGIFLFVRVLGALIVAGLLAGLFPRLAEAVIERVHAPRVRSILLTTLLGFAILVAAPVLIVLLFLTFVGFGIGLLLFMLYGLLALLGVLYAGILLGGLIARRFFRRTEVLWRDGVIGMLAFSLIALVPVVGPIVVVLFTTFATGALLQIFFNFAFPREGTAGLVY